MSWFFDKKKPWPARFRPIFTSESQRYHPAAQRAGGKPLKLVEGEGGGPGLKRPPGAPWFTYWKENWCVGCTEPTSWFPCQALSYNNQCAHKRVPGDRKGVQDHATPTPLAFQPLRGRSFQPMNWHARILGTNSVGLHGGHVSSPGETWALGVRVMVRVRYSQTPDVTRHLTEHQGWCNAYKLRHKKMQIECKNSSGTYLLESTETFSTFYKR